MNAQSGLPREVLDRNSAVSLAQRISNEIRLRFQFEDKATPLDAAIGMAVSPDDGAEIETLIESADTLMYEVKRTRRNHR